MVPLAVVCFIALMEAVTVFSGEWLDPHGFGAYTWRALVGAVVIGVTIETISLPKAIRMIANSDSAPQFGLLAIAGVGSVGVVSMLVFLLWAPL
jgi:hypothetical protein